jgi:REP element-mobilizing transposase RayT
VNRDPAQACGGFNYWLLERQECGGHCAPGGGKLQNFTGAHFWARGYAVSTVGYELEKVKRYIREQEAEIKPEDFKGEMTP